MDSNTCLNLKLLVVSEHLQLEMMLFCERQLSFLPLCKFLEKNMDEKSSHAFVCLPLFFHVCFFSLDFLFRIFRSDWPSWPRRMLSERRRRRRRLGGRRRWWSRWRRPGRSPSTIPTWWTRCSVSWERPALCRVRKDKRLQALRWTNLRKTKLIFFFPLNYKETVKFVLK